MAISEKGCGFRELPEDLAERLEDLPRLLEERGVRLAYLFGSVAESPRDARPEDVDLALLTDGEPAERLRNAVTDALGTARVDLVDLATAPPVLRFEIVRSGEPIHVRDDETMNRFELDTLHLWAGWTRSSRRPAGTASPPTCWRHSIDAPTDLRSLNSRPEIATAV